MSSYASAQSKFHIKVELNSRVTKEERLSALKTLLTSAGRAGDPTV